jgi:protein-S-isoprenylcysteine O-methyltransferase Ste14
LSIYLLGLVIFAAAIITAAQTPSGMVFPGGIYRYSRHPLYLSSLVLLLGVTIACAAWIFLLLAAAYIYLSLRQVAGEEQACLAAFGSSYRSYMDVTPRWIGIPRTKKV